MKYENELALIIAYYLSKFDETAYRNLGFGNKTETHKEIGRILNVKSSTIQNMRDEFDPIHDNPRAGWYQKQLSRSRIKVVNSFDNLDENELREVVLEILRNKTLENQEEFHDLVKTISIKDSERDKTTPYLFRGITGKKAEEHFINYHANTNLPVTGLLVDKREYGCGYDFEIINNDFTVFIEVKGLSDLNGGISFTDKEWKTANKQKERYFLILVKNINDKPEIQIIKNPSEQLHAEKAITTVVQINWYASANQFKTDINQIK